MFIYVINLIFIYSCLKFYEYSSSNSCNTCIFYIASQNKPNLIGCSNSKCLSLTHWQGVKDCGYLLLVSLVR